jgi:hypothetical protein
MRAANCVEPHVGPFKFLVIHKPGEKDEDAPIWQGESGQVLWLGPSRNNIPSYGLEDEIPPNYGLHVADLVEPMPEPEVSSPQGAQG